MSLRLPCGRSSASAPATLSAKTFLYTMSMQQAMKAAQTEECKSILLTLADMPLGRERDRLIAITLGKDSEIAKFRHSLLQELNQLPTQNCVRLNVDQALIPAALDAVYVKLDRLARGLHLLKDLSEMGGIHEQDFPALMRVSCQRVVEVMALLPIATPTTESSTAGPAFPTPTLKGSVKASIPPSSLPGVDQNAAATLPASKRIKQDWIAKGKEVYERLGPEDYPCSSPKRKAATTSSLEEALRPRPPARRREPGLRLQPQTPERRPKRLVPTPPSAPPPATSNPSATSAVIGAPARRRSRSRAAPWRRQL